MQTIHGMRKSKMKKMKRGEAYLVDKVHCLLFLFKLRKPH